MKKFKIKKSIKRLVIFFNLCFLFIFFAAFAGYQRIKESANGNQDETVKGIISNESRKLPLYGFNGNNIKGPSWSNKSFRDSVSSLRLKVIRYPGGTISNWWQWQKGGFVDDPSLPEKFKRRYTPTTLEDLKLLVDETNCDVVFTLNMITKDLQDQLEMLSHAQSLKIPVKYIELGNEFTNAKNPGRQKFLSAEDYGKTCEQWIDAIKSRFPNVKIAVVGGNRNYSENVKNWNKLVLQNAPNADAIVAHLYPARKNIIDASGINFQKLFEELVNTFNNQGFTSVNNKNIWITEYNINWASEANEDDDKSVPSSSNAWSQALSTLLLTSAVTSISPNTTVILNHNISNTSVFAAIETENKTFRKLPNGIGMAEWLAASDQMNTLTKINFTDDKNQMMQDYQLFGWKFFNNKNSALLLVNLLATPLKLNVADITKQNATYETKYAGKNDIINSAADIKYKTGTISNSTIELPGYSVTIIKG